MNLGRKFIVKYKEKNYVNYFAGRKLYKEYKTSSGAVNALNGVDLSIEKGLFYAIIGRSGSGKIHPASCSERTGQADIRKSAYRRRGYVLVL